MRLCPRRRHRSCHVFSASWGRNRVHLTDVSPTLRTTDYVATAAGVVVLAGGIVVVVAAGVEELCWGLNMEALVGWTSRWQARKPGESIDG